MRLRSRLAGGVSVLLLTAAAQTPVPTPAPVFELHRTAAASHIDPATANPLFVLVIGSDVREGDPARGRADSLHIVAVNTVSGRGTIVGIPRDSYVPIPGRGTNKINASLFFGGPQLTAETVARLSGLPIHYWALVEFSRFRNLVDRLRGIDMDVPYAMSDDASGAHFPPGLRHMNGAEALAFSRARKTVPGGDFGRSENQGRLLLAATRKFKVDAADPFRLADYMLAFRDLVATDVPIRDLLHLGAIGRRLDPDGLRNVVLPGGGGSAGAASVVFLAPGASDIFNAIRDDAEL